MPSSRTPSIPCSAFGDRCLQAEHHRYQLTVLESNAFKQNIAACITVENPDEGFKPTSGSIERIKFQSASDVWGYFSFGANSRVESMFDSKLKDDVVRQMTKDNADSLDVVIATNLAHQQLKRRSGLILSLIREIETFDDRFGQGPLPAPLYDALETLTKFEDKKTYGDVALAAENFVRQSKVPGFDVRIEELIHQLLDEDVDLDKLYKSPTLSAGVDLLTYLLKDKNAEVRGLALEVYIRRVHCAHRILDIKVDEVDGKMQCKWSFRFADIPESKSVFRHGLLRVVDSTDTVGDDLDGVLSAFGSDLFPFR